jgi:hypothetical protein
MESGLAAVVAAKGGAIAAFIIVIIVMAIWAVFLFWGWKVAKGKGYSPWIGLALAFFLGLIGIIICYVLPQKGAPQVTGTPMMGGTPMAPSPMGQTAVPAPPAAAPAPPAAPPQAAAPPAPPAGGPTPPPPAPPTV